MEPKCPINSIGIRHPVMCSDVYMYEEKCLVDWINSNCISPMNRKFIEFVNVCEITENCLNDYCDDIEYPYERTNFTYSKDETIIKYYLKMIEEEDEVDTFFDKDLMLKLIDRNCVAIEFASDELKDDKEVILKVLERNGTFIHFASERLRYDETIVLAAVKKTPVVLFELNGLILVNDLIIETACYYNNENFRQKILSEINGESDVNDIRISRFER